MFGADCIPCILRQSIKTYRILGFEEEEIVDRINRLTKFYIELDWRLSAPEIYFEIFNWIKEDTGVYDPYDKVKRYWNEKMLSYMDKLKKIVSESKNPLYTALKISLAGNIIDFGALEEFDFESTLDKVLSSKLTIDDYRIFTEKMSKAKTLFYTLDNAGEAILDKLFIETLIENYNIEKIYVAVREEPFINDIAFKDLDILTLDRFGDIEYIKLPVRLDRHLKYEKDGIYEELFRKGDVTILKGQGNYELFYKYKDIFFLLMVKCKPVADMIGVDVGSSVFKFSR